MTSSQPGQAPTRHRNFWTRIRENVGPLTLAVALGSSVGGGGVTLIWNLASTLASKADIEDVATKSDIESVNTEIARLREAVDGMSEGAEGLPALNERMNGMNAGLERIEAALNVERERLNDVQLFIGGLQGREAARRNSGGSE